MIADDVRNVDAGEFDSGEGGVAAPVLEAPTEAPAEKAPVKRGRKPAAATATGEKPAPKKRATTTRTKKAAATEAAPEAPQLTLDTETPAAEISAAAPVAETPAPAPVETAPAPVVQPEPVAQVAPVAEASAPVEAASVPAVQPEPVVQPASVAAAPVDAAPAQPARRLIGDEMPDEDDIPITVPPSLAAFGTMGEPATGEVASSEFGLGEGFQSENRGFERNPLRFRSGRAQLRTGGVEQRPERTERPVREGGFERPERQPREGGFERPERPTREAREGGYDRSERQPREGGFRDRNDRNDRNDRGDRDRDGGREYGPRGRNLRPGGPAFNNGNTYNSEGSNFQQQQPGRRREYDLLALDPMDLSELHRLAEELGVETPPLKKDDLIHSILEAQAFAVGNLIKKGILEILPDGKGFLRCTGYLQDDGDVYVSSSQIKRFNLKTGDTVTGVTRAPKDMERFHGLLRVEAINGLSPEVMKQRKEFEKLTPIFPDDKFKLETDQTNITARIIDLVSPIGKGQRGLIVAPPKAGKTSLIKSIANSIAVNHPEVVLIVLLIDERPEEVTDISRSVRGEVVASTFDEMPENHMRVADMVLEKAKRLVEMKKDVVILMDSITRLSRASNLVVTPSGRTLSGGLDPAAMYRPKRMFGAARNIEEGGSLTILATALVDTGSRMDEMIFEEFKGTGNMDLVLDRSLFDQRIFPSIDINKSGTRRDDLLMSREELTATFHLRRTLAALDNDKSITLLIDRLKNTKSNAEFMTIVAKSARNANTSTPQQP